MFKDHHYLDDKINKAARCYIVVWDGQVIGFNATLSMPSGYIKNAWRGHRTVILPQYQGMGIGPRLSDMIAQMYIEDGCRYYSRTAHPRLISYRLNSPLWKPTSKHKKLRNDIKHDNVYKKHYADNKRVCGSFEYIGVISLID